MSLLIKGATEFLSLTDTPASYATEAQKLARVNLAETALEFATGPDVPINPVHTTDIIFGPADKSNVWENLNVGVGPCIAFLKVEMAGAAAVAAQFRYPGDTGNTPYTIMRTDFTAGRRLGYVLVVTNSAGIVEWMDNAAATNVTVTRLAYWPDPPLLDSVLYSGIGTGAFVDLDCGVKNALAIFRITSTWAAGAWRWFRVKGDPQVVGQGCTAFNASSFPNTGYVLCPTDANGIVQWQWPAGENITIRLLTYIAGASFPKLAVFSGPMPTAVSDLPTPFGRGYAFVKIVKSAVAGNPLIQIKENGEALLLSASGSPQMNVLSPAANEVAYGFVPLDVYGIFDWVSSLAHGAVVTIYGVTG